MPTIIIPSRYPIRLLLFATVPFIMLMQGSLETKNNRNEMKWRRMGKIILVRFLQNGKNDKHLFFFLFLLLFQLPFPKIYKLVPNYFVLLLASPVWVCWVGTGADFKDGGLVTDSVGTTVFLRDQNVQLTPRGPHCWV